MESFLFYFVPKIWWGFDRIQWALMSCFDLGSPPLVNKSIPTMAEPHVCFICVHLLLVGMLEAVDTACLEAPCMTHFFCITLENDSFLKQQQNYWRIHSVGWCGGKNTQSVTPNKKRTHVECFRWSACVKERSRGTEFNGRPTAYYIVLYCLLYCILMSTGFTVKNLYYVSIFGLLRFCFWFSKM